MPYQVEKTVFISYRRTNIFHARAIFQNLRANGYDVFMDYESIDSGAFDQIILNQIKARAHFLVLLTPSALERCSEPGDWLRREIETAIEEKRNIVPLYFDGFNFEDIDKYLPSHLKTLGQYNALQIPAAYFDEAMERLRVRFLDKPLDLVIHPTPSAQQTIINSIVKSANAEPDLFSFENLFLQELEGYGVQKLKLETTEFFGIYQELRKVREKRDEKALHTLVEGMYFLLEHQDRGLAIDKFREALLDNHINEIFESLRDKQKKRRFIFLSYSRVNQEVMKNIRDFITEYGFEIWTDENILPGTQSWTTQIAKAIEQSKAIVVLLSPDAKLSEWVSMEILYARERGTIVIPILIDGDPKDSIPLYLVATQYIDARGRFPAAVLELIKTLNSLN